MKLRINDRSIRLRLLRSEVERFHSTGVAESAIDFGAGSTLRFRLVTTDATAPIVRFTGALLEVALPSADAEMWSGGTKVGVYGNVGNIELLVEKDFRRTSAPSPDDADRYPNPRAARGDSPLAATR